MLDVLATAFDERGVSKRIADWRAFRERHLVLPTHAPLAPHHVRMWDWLAAIERGVRQRPLVAVLPREGLKSTTAEEGVVFLGHKRAVSYVLYVCETQKQANAHVAEIRELLGTASLEEDDPPLTNRRMTKYGASAGWTMQRLRTRSGLKIDGYGLDSALRGIKVDADRPDLVVLDDIDGEFDTPSTTQKKIDQITRKVFPAGTGATLNVLAVQNVVTETGVFARLARIADESADFLADRIVIGPIPSLVDMTVEQREDPTTGAPRFFITGGTPTWEGQDLDDCQALVDTWGISSFRKENQHEVEAPPGGMYDHLDWHRIASEDVPTLKRITVACDPAVKSGKGNSSQGVQADGLGIDGRLYRLASYEGRKSPREALRTAYTMAVRLARIYRCPRVRVIVEENQGGDTWVDTANAAWRELVADDGVHYITGDTNRPAYGQARAQGSKEERSSRMLYAYESGTVTHVVGTHQTLEKALYRFPETEPLDLADAAYHAWNDLQGGFSGTIEGTEISVN